jgi:hypothetical protein
MTLIACEITSPNWVRVGVFTLMRHDKDSVYGWRRERRKSNIQKTGASCESRGIGQVGAEATQQVGVGSSSED